MAQLAEWPAVVTCGRTVDEARAMLLDAAREVASYRGRPSRRSAQRHSSRSRSTPAAEARELERHLRDRGCEPIRRGADHAIELGARPAGAGAAASRDPDGTARAICRQLGRTPAPAGLALSCQPADLRPSTTRRVGLRVEIRAPPGRPRKSTQRDRLAVRGLGTGESRALSVSVMVEEAHRRVVGVRHSANDRARTAGARVLRVVEVSTRLPPGHHHRVVPGPELRHRTIGRRRARRATPDSRSRARTAACASAGPAAATTR